MIFQYQTETVCVNIFRMETTYVVNWLLVNSLVVGGVLISFWLWALTDCLLKEEPTIDKICWVIVVVCLNALGAFLYVWHRKLARVSAKGAGLLPPGV